ncbi:MAG: gamma-glutamyl-gamma-aminobutyrate hydrolase family protein [Chloroflexota bacterium]|nr:gamma-glutamyl-gamma-aminobutyrate hydrolase family protein [Chloroflexota bacterium]
MKPMIGITASLSADEMAHGTFYRYALSRTYTDAVHAAGGVPVILPERERDLDPILGRIDGLLLSGGGDIDPARFNETTVHPKTYGISDERDAFEIAAFRAAVKRDLPTLCICRGIQVMSVAQGGTLHQHIPDDVPDEIGHRQHEHGKTRDEVGHGVRLTDGHHLLRSILGKDELEVNSFHHQAVAVPGDHLEVLARSEDGVIEALCHPGMRFGLGVQWHPEMLAHIRADHAALFAAFIAASEQS